VRRGDASRGGRHGGRCGGGRRRGRRWASSARRRRLQRWSAAGAGWAASAPESLGAVGVERAWENWGNEGGGGGLGGPQASYSVSRDELSLDEERSSI
jgi:hypothetical protein